MSDDVDIEDPLDFWNSYDWNWESAADVKQFIEDAVEREVYEYAWGALSEIGEENFYTNWWYPVQNAIKLMATNFSKEELNLSIKYLLEGDNGESDPSILDALIKHVPGFPEEYPEFDHFIDELLPEDFYSDWWEFTWYPFVDRYFTWTFWAPETLARSENVNPLYLRRIFRTSITSDHSYKTFRARVALATNPKCPSEIIDFLFENRNKPDWLFRDAKEEGIFQFVDEAYSIDRSVTSFSEIEDEARKALEFKLPTNERWDSCPNAYYVGNLLGIEWEADSARICLLAALAKNTALTSVQYSQLAEESHPLVRYFLSKNPSIPLELKTLLILQKPTFTFKPYGGDSSMTDSVTLT